LNTEIPKRETKGTRQKEEKDQLRVTISIKNTKGEFFTPLEGDTEIG